MNVVIAHGGNIGFPGGGTNRVLVFAKALSENDYDVSLVVPKPIGEIPKDIKKSIKIYTVPIKPKSDKNQIARAFLVSLMAKRLARKKNAILQIEHSTLGGVASFLGCSDYVLDIHDLELDSSLYKSIPLAPKLVYKLERSAVRKASKIIVVSEFMKEFIEKEWEISEEKIKVISNGYFSERLKKFESVEESGLLSFIGVLTHNVAYDKIVKLAESLDKKSKISVIGDGPMHLKFLNELEEKGIKKVMVHGYLPDEEAYKILAKSQICINPRVNDFHTKVSAGIKNFDYAALGKAIATDRDGTAVIFEKHNAALVSDPANQQEFIENVHRLVDDEKLRKRLGKNARKLVTDFTWAKQGERLVRMYEAVFNS